MGNITDYVAWRGDLGFASDPLNDKDALVLSQLVYTDLGQAWRDAGGPVSVRALVRACDEAGGVRILTTTTGEAARRREQRFVRAAAASRRFGGLTVEDVADVSGGEGDLSMQFFAMSLRIAPDLRAVCFRGTDDTLAGWREDFMISFTRTPAQKAAVEFTERQIRGHGGRFILMGHSKGGNLAYYAASFLDPALAAALERVYTLDGPGLCPEVMADGARPAADISPITRRITPYFSFVGGIFAPQAASSTVVDSSAVGFNQHDLMSWRITHNRLAERRANAPTSVWAGKVLDTWLEGISQEGRRSFTDALFSALAARGATTIGEATSGPTAPRGGLIGVLAGFDTNSMRIAFDLPAAAWNAKADALAALQATIQDTRRR